MADEALPSGNAVAALADKDEGVREKAVEAFQRHFRPARVDGRADLSTRDTLARLLAARSA